MVKNLTVALDESTFRKARIAAAERGVSISALVREYFATIDQQPHSNAAKVPPRNLLDFLGDEGLAEIPLTFPKFDEAPRKTDFE